MSVRTVDALIQAIGAGESFDFLLFWGHKSDADGRASKSCLSQWCPAHFCVDGVEYATAEHFMMVGKAELFNDEPARAAILATADPRQAKAHGRVVARFDQQEWDGARRG